MVTDGDQLWWRSKGGACWGERCESPWAADTGQFSFCSLFGMFDLFYDFNVLFLSILFEGLSSEQLIQASFWLIQLHIYRFFSFGMFDLFCDFNFCLKIP